MGEMGFASLDFRPVVDTCCNARLSVQLAPTPSHPPPLNAVLIGCTARVQGVLVGVWLVHLVALHEGYSCVAAVAMSHCWMRSAQSQLLSPIIQQSG